jgi:acylphosphatase
VIFEGRVQGVGFRYTTASIAKRFPVTGYVRNLADGRVEIVAEGDPESVEKFLNQVASAFSGQITGSVRDYYEPDQDFSRFQIRY